MDDTQTETVYFDATLRPHRSLDPRGFLLVMVAIAGGGFTIGFAFFLAGAWPVAGFCGLEVLLIYIGFKMNFREGRRCEHLFMTDDGLNVSKTEPNGKTHIYKLEPTWLRVLMENPPRPGSRLLLTSHGKALEIGSFLLPDERLEVAEALRDAVYRYRTGHPV
ncbi:DUF2244 domain-containing protein [Rhodospirillaceae bacterium KN72]|uniref:DUF2244 domain-containing protein n=1 Tax=Pacificispira spongiicola TaxID=2729598 RepID=A0A7Y0HFG5_9PROT|nr:DUF2244 domain-containing protein [Pacificispira spongiicola]NMM45830.1 DUF2244 domain-containing protein [Pacificispira spongiicola]